MAYPTSVNDQITDSITQVSTTVLGNAPAMASSTLQQATAQALGNGAHNATSAQQQANILHQAVTTVGSSLLFGLNTASTSKGTVMILKS